MKIKETASGVDTGLGDELVESLAEGMAILRGDTQPTRLHPAPTTVDVRAIRKKLGLTQPRFAQRFGFGLAAVRDWEQGRYQPDQAMQSYLLVIEQEPEAVQRVSHKIGT